MKREIKFDGSSCSEYFLNAISQEFRTIKKNIFILRSFFDLTLYNTLIVRNFKYDILYEHEIIQLPRTPYTPSAVFMKNVFLKRSEYSSCSVRKCKFGTLSFASVVDISIPRLLAERGSLPPRSSERDYMWRYHAVSYGRTIKRTKTTCTDGSSTM